MMEPQAPTRQYAGVGPSAKSLLRNVIRHTDTHNRLREEADMWQLHRKMKQTKGDSDSNDSSRVRPTHRKGRSRERSLPKTDRGDLDIQHSFLYDDRSSMHGDRSWRRGFKQAHMDDVSMATDGSPGGSGSTYWMRQLQKAEAADPDRWGHEGFKELYPANFESDRSDDDNKKVEKKKHLEESRKISRKRKSKSRDSSKKRKKKKKRKEESSDSESDSKRRKERKSRKKTKSKKKKRRKEKSVDSVKSSAESDSDENSDEKRPWKSSDSKKRKVDMVRNGGENGAADTDSESDHNDSDFRRKERRKRRERKIGRDESGFRTLYDSLEVRSAKEGSKFKNEHNALEDAFSEESSHKKSRRKNM